VAIELDIMVSLKTGPKARSVYSRKFITAIYNKHGRYSFEDKDMPRPRDISAVKVRCQGWSRPDLAELIVQQSRTPSVRSLASSA
jgi:hypothetical protein